MIKLTDINWNDVGPLGAAPVNSNDVRTTYQQSRGWGIKITSKGRGKDETYANQVHAGTKQSYNRSDDWQMINETQLEHILGDIKVSGGIMYAKVQKAQNPKKTQSPFSFDSPFETRTEPDAEPLPEPKEKNAASYLPLRMKSLQPVYSGWSRLCANNLTIRDILSSEINFYEKGSKIKAELLDLKENVSYLNDVLADRRLLVKAKNALLGKIRGHGGEEQFNIAKGYVNETLDILTGYSCSRIKRFTDGFKSRVGALERSLCCYGQRPDTDVAWEKRSNVIDYLTGSIPNSGVQMDYLFQVLNEAKILNPKNRIQKAATRVKEQVYSWFM